MKIKNFHIPIIFIAVLLAFISNYGSFIDFVEPFTFLKFDASASSRGYIQFLSFQETYNLSNEWWRLITPMFIHFSFTHLAFNCLWVYVLGSKIELYDGHIKFIFLVVLASIFSNYIQYSFSGPSLFGGLSGVIYAMIGYCMIVELNEKKEKYGLPPAIYLFMIIWLILGFLGILTLFGFGNIANFAHLGGLIFGIIFAMISSLTTKEN